MKPLRISFMFLVLALVAGACTDIAEPTGTRTGMKPIYAPKINAFDIHTEAARTMEDPGKIYLYGNYVFIVEKAEGIHVIDNTDPSNPVKVNFIRVTGINDVAVKGHHLYADNISDLVAIDISDISEVTVSKRVKDVYPIDQMFYPSNYSGYFECADTSQGYVIGWIETELTNPKCYR